MSKNARSTRPCRKPAVSAKQPRGVCRTFHDEGKKPTTLADSVLNHGKALTVAELALLLAVSIKTIYKMVEAGRIPHMRVFGSIRFDPATTAAWIQLRSVS
jgi:excisionase family DNA binding protein